MQSSEGESDVGQSLEETRHKLPSPLLVESPRTHFVLPAAHCDGTCDLFSVSTAHESPAALGFLLGAENTGTLCRSSANHAAA